MVKIFLYGVIVCAILLSLVSASMTINEEDDSNNIINLGEILSGIATFLGLTDTPNSYAGEGSQCVIVNAGETALEFGACGGGGGGTGKTTTGYFLYNNTATIFFNGTQLNETIDIRAIDTDTQKTTNGYFLYNDTTLIYYNGTQLNNTIDSRTASTIYLPYNVTLLSGTLDDGNTSSLFVPSDDDTFNVSESSGASPLTVVINYTGVEDFTSILMRLRYEGGSGHEIEVGLWDYDDGVYEEEYGAITDMDSFAYVNYNVYDADTHLSGTNVSLRLRHVENGITSHDLFIDYAILVDGFSEITVSSHDALSGRDNLENHPQYFDTDGTRNVTTITVLQNVTVLERTCYTLDCSSYIFHNGTGLVIQG